MDRLLLPLLIVGSAQASICQAQQTWAYKSDLPAAKGWDVAVNAAGEVFTLIQNYDPWAYQLRTVVTKHKANGELIWSRLFIPPAPGHYVEGWQLATTADGGVVFAGCQGVTGTPGIFVARVDQFGDLVWCRKSSYTDQAWSSFIPRWLAITDAGDVLVAGDVHAWGTGYSVFLSQLSDSGATVFSKLVHAGTPYDYMEDITTAPNGDILLLVMSELLGKYLWLARLSASGTPIQGSAFDVPHYTRGWRIFSEAMGVRLFISGGSTTPGSNTVSGLRSILLDSAWNVTSCDSYVSDTLTRAAVNDLERVGDEGYIATGGIDGALSSAMLLRLAGDGNVMWTTGLAGTGNFYPNVRYGYSVAAFADTGFVFTGICEPDSVIMNWDEPWAAAFLSRADTLGQLPACTNSYTVMRQSCSIGIDPLTITTAPFAPWVPFTLQVSPGPDFQDLCLANAVPDRSRTPASMSIHPNPTTGQCTLSIGEPTDRVQEVRVFNSLGALVLAISNPQMTNGTDIDLDVSGLRPGVYLVAVQLQEGRATTRLVVE